MEQSTCADQFQEQVVEKYSEMVYRLAFSQLRSKTDADDVYQEVFFRYFRRQPSFQSEEHRKAWLLRVTMNCCKKLWASSWRRKIVFWEEGEETFSFPDPEVNELREQLLRLPSSYRAVVHLFYFEDMSVEEVAQFLGRKPSTVRTQLTRARRLLHKYFDED